MSSIFTRLFRKPHGTIRNARGCKPDRARLGVESLECREVPAYISAGSLVIDGTAGADTVSVTYSTGAGPYGTAPKYRVVENGSVQTFSPFLITTGQVKFRGNNGDDTFTNNSGLNTWADGGNGNDTLIGGWYNDTLIGGNGADTLSGEGGNDLLIGGNNTIQYVNDDGADRIFGGAGDDVLTGNEGDDYLDGGEGRDTLSGLDGNDTMYGGNGNDDLYGYWGDDTLDGGGGNDYVSGNDGNDTVYGGIGNDTVNGGSGNDVADGGGGDDVVHGNDGNDYVSGNEGYDLMYGDAGDDTINGGGGNDTAFGNDGNDTMFGNDGSDTMFGGAGWDVMSGEGGNDFLYGEDGDDVLRGEAGADVLDGGNGDDTLYGGTESDTLYGRGGNDGLFGGAGWLDTLQGGDGNDRFLNPNFEDAVDVIGAGVLDIELEFHNGGSLVSGNDSYTGQDWTDTEIERVDRALAILHRFKGGPELLRTAWGQGARFARHGTENRGFNDGSSAHLTNAQLNGSDTWLFGYVLHEMGHYFHGRYDATAFNALSGWSAEDPGSSDYTLTTNEGHGNFWYLNDAGFASGYATTNPDEDFAESFSAFFTQYAGLFDIYGQGWGFYTGEAGANAIPEKMDFLYNWAVQL